MQDVILLVSTSAIFIFGYFLMKKLDVFLENNWNEQETALTYSENSLRIGFSNPLMAGGLADAFETYGKQHPDVSIHIFSGEESELCRELETHKLDIIFLPENTDISKKPHYNSRMVLLSCTPVVMEYADLPAIFGPVIIAIRLLSQSSSASLGTKKLSRARSSTTGWRLSFKISLSE